MDYNPNDNNLAVCASEVKVCGRFVDATRGKNGEHEFTLVFMSNRLEIYDENLDVVYVVYSPIVKVKEPKEGGNNESEV